MQPYLPTPQTWCPPSLSLSLSFSVSLFLSPSLSSLSSLFKFNDLFTHWYCLCTYEWVLTHKQPQVRKTVSPFSKIFNFQLGVGPHEFFSPNWAMLTGLIFCKSWAGIHSCCQFTMQWSSCHVKKILRYSFPKYSTPVFHSYNHSSPSSMMIPMPWG